MALLIVLFSLSLLHLILESSIHAFNTKFPFPLEFGFAYGPLAYLHLLHIKDPLRKTKIGDFLHFIPTVLLDVILYYIFFSVLRLHMDWAYSNIILIQSLGLGMSALGIIQFSIYTFLLHRESKETLNVLRDYINVRKWVSTLVVSWTTLIIFLVFAIPISLFLINELDEYSKWLYYPLGTLMALWIVIIGFSYLLKYSPQVESYIKKVSNFQFTQKELTNKKDTLLSAIVQNKLYKNPKLTVANLAGFLGWPINTVSKLINEHLETNFNDLINKHRILEFERLSAKSEAKKYSILGMSQEVGFNSKASFYRIFKEHKGITPTEFINSLKEESQMGI